jgi:hypothetical protein
MTDEVHDTSRVDNFLAARNRAMLWHAAWRPLLAGAVGASLIIAAVWVATPRFTTREVVVDHVIPKDVTVNNLVPHPVEVEIPHIVIAAPTAEARTPEERRFVGTEAWRGADVRGRILRPDGNGFVLATDAGEQSFFPARISAGGKLETDESMKDVVSGLLNDLAYCRPSQSGLYQCVALHEGRETPIPEIPIIAKRGKPA